MHLDFEIDIPTTPATLWHWLTEPEAIKRWMPAIESDEPLTPGPPGVGTRSRMTLREGKRSVRYETELTTYDVERLLTLDMRGGSLGTSPMQVRYHLTARGETTRLHYTADWRPNELGLRLLSPLIRIAAGRNARASLDRLARLTASAAP